MPLEKKNYDPASPIWLINGIVTTERSGIGKWGAQSKKGLIDFCSYLKTLLPENFSMAEIGSYAGESTVAFAMIAGKVYAVDPWMNGYDDDDLSSSIFPMEIVKASFNYRVRDYHNIIPIVATSDEAANMIPDKSLDFVYYDAVHKIGPMRDHLKQWIPKINNNGYIGGHDFCGFWSEVVDAVLETVGLPDFVTKDGSWLKKIT